MERTISAEEKIRRAEEIYARRQNGYSKNTIATVNVSEEKRNYGLLKKMMLQISICLVIYFIMYLIQTSNYVFSENTLNTVKQVLSYDIDIPQLYSQFCNYINDINTKIITNVNQNTIEENKVDEQNSENTANSGSENAIGGAELQNVIMENEEVSQNNSESEELKVETDDEYIKNNFSFIKPVEGVVSSEFGQRDVNNPIVSKNHTGIDIAANTGTVIRAAMDGKVVVSSTTGDYGYHIKIVNNDVTTLYGHCNKLYVSEGDEIKQGQEIAEVGTTGKSTGPHLHFEIMRGQTYINPRNILEF